MKVLGKLLLTTAVAIAAWVTWTTLELDVRIQDHGAQAIDLFGSDDDEPRAFWREGGSAEPIIPQGVPGSFADLAERASPGVVNISTERTVTRFSPFREFAPFFGGQLGPFPEQQERVPSLGSGFVISPDGYIVTNNHVVENVDTIKVVLSDGVEYDAQVIGRDPKTDIALIRVEPDEPLYALPLGDSDKVRPGEWVVAIGNPYSLEHTVTAGIVSAKHRDLRSGQYDDYIQTDAAIKPGNSGGPLLNLAGEVIGINTAINPRANTIGFAVPVNMAKAILPQLRAKGRVTRGLLGVHIQELTPELTENLELEDSRGALVAKVVAAGPADRAGIQHGDVIREFDGTPIVDFNDLPRIVAATPVNKKVEIVVMRDGKRRVLKAVIGEMDAPRVERVSARASRKGASAFGMRVQNLTPDIAEQLGLPDGSGVLVSDVDPMGPARQAGIRSGDVIVEIDQAPVTDIDALQNSLDGVDARALLLIRRGDGQRFVTLEREES